MPNPLRKGKDFERRVAGILKQMGFNAWRVPVSGVSGPDRCDVVCGMARIECKKRATHTGLAELYTWLRNVDAAVAALDGQEPLFVCRLRELLDVISRMQAR